MATGTGSGKTECFLWPILDHCRRHAGEEGVKAILVYPMNALAFDQARRIAKIIHDTPALRGKVSAGLYVGEREKAPHTTMGREHLVTDRETLRERPPHILLTNYKMLDFLMIRPADRRLWRRNQPSTLRYLVVDELHTFDGPQGTDLACLIRRLRERLQVPRQESPGGGLICVGTSATVGDEGNSAELRQYAADVFGQAFDEHAILREERQSIDELLGTAIIQTHVAPQPNLAERVDPARYADAESYLKAQHELFFGAAMEGDFHAVEWRIALAKKLRGHLMFVNLLRTLADGPLPLPVVAARMRTSLPLSTDGVQAEREAVGLLNGLCALISAAQAEDDGAGMRDISGLLNGLCGLHLCGARRLTPHGVREAVSECRAPTLDASRELRRMVCRPANYEALNAEPATTMLRHSDDLNPEDSALHLPLVQCRECRVTGWGAVQRAATSQVGRDLREFYNRFFSRGMDMRFYFPAEGKPPAGVAGRNVALCGHCGHIHAGHGCRRRRLHKLRRRRAGARVLPGVFNQQRQSHRPQPRLCPFCNASEALIIVGARASSLLSVVLGQTFASRHNDDAGSADQAGHRVLLHQTFASRHNDDAGGQAESAANDESAGAQKVIALSDNAQDAAHRAGFFSARTWQNSVRTAIAQVVAAQDGIALSDLPPKVAHVGGAMPKAATLMRSDSSRSSSRRTASG